MKTKNQGASAIDETPSTVQLASRGFFFGKGNPPPPTASIATRLAHATGPTRLKPIGPKAIENASSEELNDKKSRTNVVVDDDDVGVMLTNTTHMQLPFKTELIVGAKPIALGAICMQINVNDKDDVRILSYSSRLLSDVERRYSQLEKECLAIVWASEKFHGHLHGRPFTIVVNNKALENIFDSRRQTNSVQRSSKPSVRIERWLLRMAKYEYTLMHRQGIDNPADYLLRTRQPEVQNIQVDANTDNDQHVKYLFSATVPQLKALTNEEIIKATNDDPVMQELIRRIKGSKFNLQKRISNEYDHVFHELSVSSSNIVIRQPNSSKPVVVIPESLRNRVIDIGHEGHQDTSKTINLIRSKVWFPKLDKLVEERIASCQACQINQFKSNYEHQSQTSEQVTMAHGPWSLVSIVFYGPTPSNTQLLVLTDEYSKYVIVKEIESVLPVVVIPVIHEILAEFGIPKAINSDSGTPFNSIEFEAMCKYFGIRHRYNLKQNSDTERFSRDLTKVMKNAAIANSPWKKELNLYLGAYRATPHSATGVSPAQLVFRFNNTCRLIDISHMARIVVIDSLRKWPTMADNASTTSKHKRTNTNGRQSSTKTVALLQDDGMHLKSKSENQEYFQDTSPKDLILSRTKARDQQTSSAHSDDAIVGRKRRKTKRVKFSELTETGGLPAVFPSYFRENTILMDNDDKPSDTTIIQSNTNQSEPAVHERWSIKAKQSTNVTSIKPFGQYRQQQVQNGP